MKHEFCRRGGDDHVPCTGDGGPIEIGGMKEVESTILHAQGKRPGELVIEASSKKKSAFGLRRGRCQALCWERKMVPPPTVV